MSERALQASPQATKSVLLVDDTPDIRAFSRTSPTRQIEIEMRRLPHAVEISVVDHGRGIPPTLPTAGAA